MYRSLARWCTRHAWFVVGIWLLALVGINALGAMAGDAFRAEFSSPDSESTRGFDTLEEYFADASSAFSGSIVFRAADGVDDPAVVAAMSEMFTAVEAMDDLSIASPYEPFGAGQVSDSGQVAFARINVAPTIADTAIADYGVRINDLAATAEAAVDGLDVEIGGAIFAHFEPPQAELIGLAFAIVVLILAFGSVLAMGLPISVAIAGVGTGGFGIVTLLTHVTTIPEFTPMVGIMIGLGVGIDYALFIVTRYRELTRAHRTPAEAITGALDTAGRAVVFAGITVVVSLLGMLLIGLPFVAGLGIGAAATVAVTLVASVTLLPALLAITADHVEVTRWRGLLAAGGAALALLGLGLKTSALTIAGVAFAAAVLVASLFVPALRARVPSRRHRPLRKTIAFRWSRNIQQRPWFWVLVGTAVLVVLALPVLGLRLGFSDEGNYAPDTTTRRAYDLIADGFGPGFNGPLILVLQVDDPRQAAVIPELTAAIAADPGIASVAEPFPNDLADPAASEAFLVQIIPTHSPQDEATIDTVNRLRSDVISPIVEGTGVEANLTGVVPANIDFSNYLSERILVFFAAVLGVSFLLLMMVFRSVLVPLKAVIMNTLSIGSAYGVLVALFQWGWLGGITGLQPAPIEPFVPMMLFAIVFGLSMDYEVFLLSRIKEEYDRTGDPHTSVADGLAATARVISAAAAIMVVVFGSFVLEDDRIIKMFGVGLALAVLLDATLVRMLLVPATMELLGRWNWWLPTCLERIAPTLNVEGDALHELHIDHAADATAFDADRREREPV